jgi:hypothetical protein
MSGLRPDSLALGTIDFALDDACEQQHGDHDGGCGNEEEVQRQLRRLGRHLHPGVEHQSEGHDHGDDSCEVVLVDGGQVSHAL